VREGWQTTPFEGCIQQVTYTAKILRKDFLNEGAFPIVSQEEEFINGWWKNEADLFKVDQPLVLFGDHTRVLKYVDFDFILGADGVKILKPKSFLHPRYFYYQLHTAKLESLGYARHFRLLKQHKVSYPEIAEQRRIVTLLDEAFADIATAKAHAEKNLQNSRELFESHLEAAFTKQAGWELKKFGDLADFRNGINFTKNSKGDEIKIVGVRDFQKNFLAPIADLETIIPDGEIPASDLIKSGDILFVRSNGNPELIGRSLLVGDLQERITHSGFTIKARLRDSQLSPIYLCHFLKSGMLRRKMIEGGNGVNIKSLNQGTLSGLNIAFPEKSKQLLIVGILEKVQAEISDIESIFRQKLSALDELKKSLLHQAFSGAL
jgi:type I restriction enzyme, S subunit